MIRTGRPVLLAAALVLSTVLAGCASTGQESGAAPEAYGTLVIENDSPLTVNVYAIRHSGRFRLGTVTGLQQEEFTLRRHMLESSSFLQIMIDPLGGQQDYFSERIFVEEGDVIQMTVSNFIR